MPWWPVWASCNVRFWRLCGITKRCSRNRRLLIDDSSWRRVKNGLMVGEVWSHLPDWRLDMTTLIVGSLRLASLISSKVRALGTALVAMALT